MRKNAKVKSQTAQLNTRDEVSTQVVIGDLVTIDSNFVIGWAMDTSNPTARLLVELLVDGVVVGERLADKLCIDAPTQYSNEKNYGFVIPLPVGVITQNVHVISAREKSTGQILGTSQPYPSKVTRISSHRALTTHIGNGQNKGKFGCIDRIDESGVHGWFVDLDNLGEVAALEIFIDEHLVGNTYPVQDRPDLAQLLCKPVSAGFSLGWKFTEIDQRLIQHIKSIESNVRIWARVKGCGSELIFHGEQPTAAAIVGWLGSTGAKPMSRSQEAKIIQAFENQKVEATEASSDDVKAIAFFLPQFHPVAENDEWWGKGFTEWTNVAQAKPLFPEHDQPRVPADLGYYDLRLTEVREAQAELAKRYGIHGFCYYYYWFGGRRILERPLQDLLDSGKPDFPFCICWANESWSRRWDGSEQEVLLKQEHTFENDVKFIHDVIPILKDARYIRTNGAPILLVYRVQLFPDPEKTAEIWRRICRENGIEKIHLCAVESFGFTNPLSIGFDSSVQFPPHGVVAQNIAPEIEGLDKHFKGNIYDYEEVVAREINKELPAYPRYPGVMCGWDNTARRKKNSNIFVNSSPENYEVWLRAAVDESRSTFEAGERFVFINAWNEWAEGTHLEPDRSNGHAYLSATQRALKGTSDWRQLLEYAQKKNDLDKTAVTSLLRDLESQLRAQDRSLKFLKKIHQGVLDGDPQRTIFHDRTPIQIAALHLETAGTGNLDRVNSYSIHQNSIVPVQKSKWMYLSGWATIPRSNISETSTAYLIMENARTRARFFALLTTRKERKDVVQALPERPESETRFAGFSCYADTTHLPADQYRVGIVQFSEGVNFIKFFGGVIDLV